MAFRLAPRLNAAGRLYRADSALELLLTDDPARAAELADELDHANAERRDIETRIRFEAEAPISGAGAGRCVRARGTRLAPRGRRHRRRAHRAAPPPSRDHHRAARSTGRARQRLGALDSGVRPARSAARLRRAPRTPRRPPCGRRADDRPGEPRRVPRGVHRARGERALARRPDPPRARRRGRLG